MYTPTRNTIIAYTEGDCWHLARTFHEMYGVPVIFSLDEPWNGNNIEAWWNHVAVMPSPGMVLDIEGMHSLRYWVDKWKAEDYLVTSSTSDILEVIEYKDDDRISRINSRRVAQRLWEEYTP